MKNFDTENWPRRPQFELYRDLDFPYFNLTASIDVTGLKESAHAAESSFTIALIYLLSKAANEIQAFRLRLRRRGVVEHERVHPSITVLAEGDRLGFCTIPFIDDFSEFNREAAGLIEAARSDPSLEDEPGRDDLLFMSAIPWVKFTSVFHPVPIQNPDSIPRLAWGRIDESSGSSQMPLSLQCHHAVVDGVHVGRFFDRLEAFLSSPASAIQQ